jgi:cell division protein FtsB
MKTIIIILAVLLLFVFGRIWFGQGSHSEITRLQQQIDTQQKANQEQEQINQKLKAEVKELKSVDDAIEERARSELGMIKRGETFYQTILKSQQQKPIEKPVTESVE